MNADLEANAREAEIVLSGSVIAVPQGRRQRVAEGLVDAGHWAHADIITGSYRGQDGVGWDEIDGLARACGPRLDVHLMVDDLDDAIDRLPDGLGRITLQAPIEGSLGVLVDRARERAAEVWIAVDDAPAGRIDEAIAAGADGIIVMLTPPGQPGHSADLSRLDRAHAIVGDRSRLGVDGGVTRKAIARLKQSDVTYAVAGRALLGAIHDEKRAL